jgi:hypothetical protein
MLHCNRWQYTFKNCFQSWHHHWQQCWFTSKLLEGTYHILFFFFFYIIQSAKFVVTPHKLKKTYRGRGRPVIPWPQFILTQQTVHKQNIHGTHTLSVSWPVIQSIILTWSNKKEAAMKSCEWGEEGGGGGWSPSHCNKLHKLWLCTHVAGP